MVDGVSCFRAAVRFETKEIVFAGWICSARGNGSRHSAGEQVGKRAEVVRQHFLFERNAGEIADVVIAVHDPTARTVKDRRLFINLAEIDDLLVLPVRSLPFVNSSTQSSNFKLAAHVDVFHCAQLVDATERLGDATQNGFRG